MQKARDHPALAENTTLTASIHVAKRGSFPPASLQQISFLKLYKSTIFKNEYSPRLAGRKSFPLGLEVRF